MDHEADDFYIYLKELKIPWSGKSEIKSKSEKNCSYLKASWTKWAGRASQELTRNIWAVPTLAKSSSSSSSYSQAETSVLVLLLLYLFFCVLYCMYFCMQCARKVQFLLKTTISVFHIMYLQLRVADCGASARQVVIRSNFQKYMQTDSFKSQPILQSNLSCRQFSTKMETKLPLSSCFYRHHMKSIFVGKVFIFNIKYKSTIAMIHQEQFQNLFSCIKVTAEALNWFYRSHTSDHS